MSFSISMPNKAQSLSTHLIQGTILGVFLTALSYALGLVFNWTDSLNWLEIFAVFTSYVCTFLCVVERRINYPIGAVSTAAYCVLFYQWDLVASMAINAFLSVYLIYGWIRWRSDSNARPVTRMSGLAWAVHLAVAAVGYGAVVLIAKLMGGQLVWTDSVILAGTILAQFMLDNKKLENWGVWALVNVFAIYTYYHAGLALAGFQYIFFLLNTAYGFYMWKQSHEEVAQYDISDIDVKEMVKFDLPVVREVPVR